MIEPERELTGGNVSTVTTDGSVVYKDRKPQSATIQRLLRHLQCKGIDFCPKPLGFDNRGREMLSFMPGNTIDDFPGVSLITDKIETVKQAASMLRKLHDATMDFTKQPDDVWFLRYDGDLPNEVICHNDFAPYNITFDNNLPVGLIDFDTACPAPRVWDIAYAVYRFVPLGESVYDCVSGAYRDYDKSKDCEERKILLGVFLNSYGFNDDIEEYIVQRLSALVNLFDEECAKGNQVFIKMKQEGHQEFYIREIEFIKKNYYDWI
ncbi:MAG: aminoglycoside phosphotransferase family protein [Oscillospiraceae bacterium]|nr:aminoglycoside phosphotransferase family protein [Oscillospiraceae bacterium]